MTVSEVLLAARDLVGQGWCQCAMAERLFGRQTHGTDPEAVRWCAVGAVHRTLFGSTQAMNVSDETVLRAGEVVRFVNLYLPQVRGDLMSWNDEPTRTASEVYGLLDDAAALAKEMGL